MLTSLVVDPPCFLNLQSHTWLIHWLNSNQHGQKLLSSAINSFFILLHLFYTSPIVHSIITVTIKKIWKISQNFCMVTHISLRWIYPSALTKMPNVPKSIVSPLISISASSSFMLLYNLLSALSFSFRNGHYQY